MLEKLITDITAALKPDQSTHIETSLPSLTDIERQQICDKLTALFALKTQINNIDEVFDILAKYIEGDRFAVLVGNFVIKSKPDEKTIDDLITNGRIRIDLKIQDGSSKNKSDMVSV